MMANRCQFLKLGSLVFTIYSWIALASDYEYTFRLSIHLFRVFTLCLMGTRLMISIQAGYPLMHYPLKRGLSVLHLCNHDNVTAGQLIGTNSPSVDYL